MNQVFLFLGCTIFVLYVIDILKDRKHIKEAGIGYLFISSLVYLAYQVFFNSLTPGTTDIVELFGSAHHISQNAALGYGKAFVIFVVTFYLSGSADYVMHRFISHSKLLWWTHEYHHLAKRVSLYMPGIAFRPYAFIGTIATTTLATLIFLIASFFLNYYNFNLLYGVFVTQLFILVMSHSSYLREKSKLSKVLRSFYITSPEDHLIHHSHNHGFVNYGNVTILWDVIFGTYKQYDEHEAYMIGTQKDKDWVSSVTFGLIDIRSFLKK